MKRKIIYLTFLLAIIFSGCSKKDSSENVDDGLNADLTNEESSNFGSQSEGIPSNATIIYDNILIPDNYNHMYQKTAGINCGGSACLAVSYMMARKIEQTNANFSTSEVNNLRTRMRTECGGIAIDEAVRIAKTDIGSCNSNKFKVKSTSTNPGNDNGRNLTKDKILESLQKGKSLIARVEVKSGGAIADYNAYTHFVVIVGLTLTDIGTGSTVYYIDPLKKNAEILDCSYTKFLNSMKSENNYYYLLTMGCL
jgi:hypothetical protein